MSEFSTPQMTDFLSRLDKVEKLTDGYEARCPAHADQKPSLTITQAADGKILIHCHAGCKPEAVVDAIGLKMKDLFPASEDWKKNNRIIAAYDYQKESGELLNQVVRYEGKQFKQRRPDGHGGWIWNMNGITPTIYHLPEVIKAVKDGTTIIIVEGEKDCINLRNVGLVATTNSGGAGKWRDSMSNHLKGASVIILPDNDTAGRRHALQVAASLREVAASVRILELPDLPPKGDVSDWLKNGGTREQLEEMAATAPEAADWDPFHDQITVTQDSNIEEGSEPHNRTERLSDLGNAKRLVRLHGSIILYCPAWGKWLIWDRTRWKIDDLLMIDRLAEDVARDVDLQCAQTDSSEYRATLRKWATSCESIYKKCAMVEWARAQVPISPDKFDQNIWLLNCLNGTIDLNTGKLLPHRQKDLITKICPVEFDPAARSEIFDNFINRVLPDPEVRRFIQKAAGYSCSGSTREELLFFLIGRPGSGKSTLMEAIAFCLGDYTKATAFATFLKRYHTDADNASPSLAELEGCRFVRAYEAEESQKMAENIINTMTGGDTVKTRHLHKDERSWKPQFKLWLIANEEPRVSSADSAIWRRLRQISLDQVIPAAEINRDLKTLLQEPEHAKAILAWLVEGCLLYQAEGLKAPEAVQIKTAEYRADSDPLAGFIDEFCEMDPLNIESAGDLYNKYKFWAQTSGENYSMSQIKFGKALIKRGCVNSRESIGERRRMWQGICLKQTNEDELDPLG